MLGAFVNVAVDPDGRSARELVRGSVATFARFSSEAGSGAALSDLTRRGVEQVAGGYRKDRHGEAGADYAQRMEDGFIDRFAVAGPADEVRRRLREIGDCGIERLIIVPGSLDSRSDLVRRSCDRFAADVLPLLLR
jgi:alkanesulfonate monooxygenase SsuD/methylene tetrahydromethanopterin reductase-like flavin-dependent oxidoreductase (luciferase family)